MRIGPLVGDFEASEDSKDLVLILHGLGGHRDYCYQKRLGKALPGLGYNSFRFDFRSCGDSDDVPDPQNTGRSVGGTDYEDLDRVYHHFTGLGYTIVCIVGHSRGVACMFTWQLQNPHIFVPFYVNCSGRFVPTKVYQRLGVANPDLVANGGYFQTVKRYGKNTKLWTPLAEVVDYASGKPEEYAQVNPDSQILTVFGLSDHIVPPEECAFWANLFGERGTSVFVPDADHNFYGKIDGKHVNYNPIVVEKVCEWLQQPAQTERWYRATSQISNPRWVSIEGVTNFRDFGGYGNITGGMLYRSAAPTRITLRGKQQLVELGITDIFDLRSRDELKRDKTQPLSVAGITTHFSPVFETQDWSPRGLAEQQRALQQTGLVSVYGDILQALVTSQTLAKVVKCLLQGGHILVHCTAGKDRTGILCAVLLLALGIDEYTVAREYELTTIGYREQRDKLYRVMSTVVDPALLEVMLGSKFETMVAAIRLLNDEYGSIDGYFDAAGLALELNQLRALKTLMRSPV